MEQMPSYKNRHIERVWVWYGMVWVWYGMGMVGAVTRHIGVMWHGPCSWSRPGQACAVRFGPGTSMVARRGQVHQFLCTLERTHVVKNERNRNQGFRTKAISRVTP